MNKRIRLLAKQAGYTPLPGFEITNESQEAFLGKFAELIVRDCVDVAERMKDWVEGQHVFSAGDRSWNKARVQQSQDIIDGIKKHFGVE